MNLDGRIAKLERTLANDRCTCPNNTDLSWPGHHPHAYCHSCGGERLLYTLKHHPRDAEPLLRNALPIISKSYDNNGHKDLSKLSDSELQQLKEALRAFANADPGGSRLSG